MSEAVWFTHQGGRQEGPFTRDELVRKLARRTPDTLVWRSGMTGWMRPSEVPELPLAAPPGPTPAPSDDRTEEFARLFGTLAREYGSEPRSGDGQLTFEVRHDGVPASIRCVPGHSDASLEITAHTGPQPPLRASWEGGFERFGKSLGLAREVQTGDEEFDRTVYLDTTLPPAVTAAITARDGFRTGVRSLLGMGFDAVQLDEEGIHVEKDVEGQAELARPSLDQALYALALVAKSLLDVDPSWSRHRPSAWPWWVSGLSVAGAIAGLAGVWLADKLWTPSGIEPFVLGIAAGGLASLLAAAVLVWLLRGRSDALLHLAISGVALLVALPCLAPAGLIAINGGLDRSPPVVHQAVVQSTSKSVHRGPRVVGPLRRRHRHYHATVSAGSGAWTVGVPREIHDRIHPGSPLTVVTRRGALGWEWDVKVQ